MSRLAAELTAALRRSQSKQTPPDGIASISPARTGLDQGVTGERPTWLRTLRSSDLVRRVAVVDRLKLCLLDLPGLVRGRHRHRIVRDDADLLRKYDSPGRADRGFLYFLTRGDLERRC